MNYTDIQIRPAVATDVPSLITLWSEAFPEDTGRDIRLFLERTRLSEECLLTEVDGQPVSMVFMLPAALRVGEDRLPLQYIYAAGTRTAYRGRGLFGDLLRQALCLAEKRDCAASFLHPAQPSLCEYYARFGYRPFFYSRILTGQAAASSLKVEPLSPAEYAGARLACAPVLVEWEPRWVEYAARPPCQAVAWADGCALCEPLDDTLYIRDLLCAKEQQSAICARLAARFSCKQYRCCATADSAGEPFGLLRPFGEMKITENAAPHMGLALD